MPKYLSLLPHVNAVLNATSAIFLVAGYRQIRQGKIRRHRNCQLAALAASIVFLLSYVTYHYFHGTTRFPGKGLARLLYFTILTSHTVLAVVIVPLVLVTITCAFRADFVRHKRIARWTLPLWLYVSVTGVLVYLMLYQIWA